jgi:hypothetical protein
MIESTTSRTDYTSNGTTGPFSIPFSFVNDADIRVVLTTLSSGEEATLVLNTDYTLTNAGSGGTLTSTTAYASSLYRLTIIGDPPLTQTVDLLPNGKFPADRVEAGLDKLTRITQRLKDLISRSFTLADGTIGFSTVIPKLAAGQLFVGNSTGTGLDAVNPVSVTPLAFASSYMSGSILGQSTSYGARSALDSINPWQNRCINGSMQIDQANEGTVRTVNTDGDAPGPDMYFGRRFVGSGTFTMQRFATGGPNDVGAGSPGVGPIIGQRAGNPEYTRITCGTFDGAPAAGAQYCFLHAIEGNLIKDINFGAGLSFQYVCFSFWARSPQAGTYGGAILNGSSNRSYAFEFSIPVANVWTLIQFGLTVDLAGTWDSSSGVGAILCVDLGSGSSYKSASLNTWIAGQALTTNNGGLQRVMAAPGNRIDLAQYQFERGVAPATAFERVAIDVELQRCKRYFQKTFRPGDVPSNGSNVYSDALKLSVFAAATTTPFVDWRFETVMRVPPVIQTFNPRIGGAAGRFTNFSTDDSGSPSAANIGHRAAMLAAASNLAANQWYIHATANARLL